ncbi:MAG: ImmA/IrrE family metallo-endopeptidase [Synechocystis sp.]|jgi:Zn-dependent peptidase ImmA (M78 family)
MSQNHIINPSISGDPIERAKEAFRAVQQYQQDWKDHGVDRVHLYFDDVEGNWLDEFDSVALETDCTKSALSLSLPVIFEGVEKLGIPRRFLKKFVFPRWWNSRLEKDDQSLLKLIDLISECLLLDINFSSKNNFLVAFQPIPNPKFKLQTKQNNSNLFSHLAMALANMISLRVKNRYEPIALDANKLREYILQKKSFIDLDAILNFCWEHGIPVVHFEKKPNSNCSKFDGMVAVCADRPVIVIGSSYKSPARLAFIIAHELGHIACNHVKEGILVDTSFEKQESDIEEEEANKFAKELLFGESPFSWSKKLEFKQLLSESRRLSIDYRVEVGSVILSYGWQTKDWKIAMSVLKKLEPNSNAPATINAYFKKYIDLNNLDQDTQDYLNRLDILMV